MTADEPWGDLLSIERVVELHELGLKAYGGLMSPPKVGCVEGSLGNAWTRERYADPDEGGRPGLLFAACVLFYLAKNHCFVEGNKRAAWLAGVQVLLSLGLDVDADTNEAVGLVTDVVEGRIRTPNDVCDWLGDRVIEMS